MAAETLLDEVLLHTMWEQPLTPEQAAAAWTDGLDTRISREFQTRLGGNWNRKGTGPFGNWDRHVAELRNRVVHAGYTRTKEEATKSLHTLDNLVEFICDRLAADATRTRYPRTAVALAGTDGLTRRNAYKGKAKKLATDPHEVNWHLTFINWREAWRRLRRDQNTTPRTPDPTNAHLLAVQHPDGTTHWCLHDRNQHLAAEATINTQDVNPDFRGSSQLRV